MASWLSGVLSGFVRRMAEWCGFSRGPGVGEVKVDADETIEALKAVETSRDKRTGHPVLIERLEKLDAAYTRMFPTRKILYTCFYRSPAAQWKAYQQGRFGNPGPVITNCDGRSRLSNHNKFPSRAADIAILEGGKVTWREECYWPLGALARECDLIWGGDWNSNGIKDEKFLDLPHVELPPEVA